MARKPLNRNDFVSPEDFRMMARKARLLKEHHKVRIFRREFTSISDFKLILQYLGVHPGVDDLFKIRNVDIIRKGK